MKVYFLRRARLFPVVLFLIGVASTTLHAQRPVFQTIYNNDDDYTVRVNGYYWHATPSGDFDRRSDGSDFAFDALNGFGSYSTFYGDVDWKVFGNRQHFLLAISPNSTSNTVTLSQDFDFLGNTFLAGTTATNKVRAFNIAPGYRYDVIRNDRGHLGIFGQIDIFDINASVSGTAIIADSQGVISTHSVTASKSELAPLPELGLEGKIFATTRIYGEGYFKGGYYFGYGDAYGFKADVGVNIYRHLDLKGGYLLGDRVAIHGTTNNTHVSVNQHGPIVGLQYSF
jgi:hypothetical protein